MWPVQRGSTRRHVRLQPNSGFSILRKRESSSSGWNKVPVQAFLDHRALRNYIASMRAGKIWSTSLRFIKRHPELVAVKPVKLDPLCQELQKEAVLEDLFGVREETTQEVLMKGDHTSTQAVIT